MSNASFDEEWAGPGDWAAMYRRLGLQVVPSGAGKRPLQNWKEFQDTVAPQATFDRWYGQGGQYAGHRNMGLIMGMASSGVFCIDLDIHKSDAARAWWADLLADHCHSIEPVTPIQKSGGGGKHVFFRGPEGWSAPTIKTSLGVDIRGQGGFIVCSPSRHDSGKDYDWTPGRGPWAVEFAPAPEWLIEAIELLHEQHGGSPTSTREKTDDSGDTKNAFGRSVDGREGTLQRWVWAAIVDLYRNAPIPPSQAEQDEVKRDVWQRYELSTKSRLVRPGVSNADLLEAEGRGWSELDRKWRYAMKKWSKEVAAAAAVPKSEDEPGCTSDRPPPRDPPPGTAHEPVSEDTILFDPWERYIVPNFPLDTLSQVLRDFIAYRAASTGGDVSAVAMAALASCAGALDQDFGLKMKRTGDWTVRPRMWVCLIGDPSSKKTPIISGCVGPLRAYESVGVEQYQSAYARWKSDEKPLKEDEPAKPTRYIINDTTIEKLGDILSRQNRGALVEVDEISGWIGSMDKYSGGKGSAADRSFWLQAYNGGPKTIDRMSRDSIFIKNLCVSFVGGIQPERLKQLTDLTSDGLLQRFLPVMMKRAAYPVEVADDEPARRYADLISLLTNLKPSRLMFDEGAKAVADELQRELFELENTDGLGPNFCSFIGKLPGVHGSISLLLHLIENPREAMFERVSERTTRAAARIVQSFVIPHALELYRATNDTAGWDGLRQLASYILTSDKERFTPSDFTSGVHLLRGLGTWDLAQKISPLVAGGWLSEDPSKRGWLVVPGLRELMVERRKTEMERKGAALKALRRITTGETDD